MAACVTAGSTNLQAACPKKTNTALSIRFNDYLKALPLMHEKGIFAITSSNSVTKAIDQCQWIRENTFRYFDGSQSDNLCDRLPSNSYSIFK